MTTFNWKSGISGNWDTAADWTPAGGPPDTSGDSALINATGAYTVSVGSPGDVNITANQVKLDDAGAALNITQGATLNLTGTSQTLAVLAGTLDVSGTLFNNGSVGIVLVQGTVNNSGLISGIGIGILVDASAGMVNNSGTLVSTGSVGIFAPVSERISNLGTIYGDVYGLQLASGSTVTNGASNNTRAMITGDSESVFFVGSGALTNFGTITGPTAVSLAQGTITNFGLISSTGIDIVVHSGGGALTNSGVITSTGSDGIFAPGSETISNLGTIAAPARIANGVQIVNATLTNGSASDTTATIDAGDHGIFSTGSITVDNYGTILGDPGNITTFGAGILANVGTVNNHGFITSTGDAVDFQGNGDATVTNWGLITNTGTASRAASAGVYVQVGDATVDNYGTIAGEASENTGVFAAGLAQVNNHGSIYGQALGVLFYVSGSTLNNDGTVSSNGGAGLFAMGNDVLNNLGTISDTTSLGNGAQMAAGSSVTNGASNDTTASIVGGHYGVFSIRSITVDNYGTILGGASGVQSPGIIDNHGLISGTGYGVLDASTLVNSGTVRGGVDGVFGSMETVSNIGTIIGDNTGLQLSAGSSVTNSGTIAGATGVWLSGGSKLTDSGSIISTAGAAGIAVQFGSSSQLVVDPVAKFVGRIFGPGAVLELAAGSGVGSIGGITRLGTLAVDKAANWTLQGTNDVSDVSDQGTLTLGANGTLTVAGTFDSADGGVVPLDAGALLDFVSGVGSSGQLQFLGSAELEVQHAAQFGTGVGTSAYAGPLIEGFRAGDTIDLRDIVAKGATMDYTASTGLMQITSGANLASLLFDTATLGSGSFHFSQDNIGHLLLTHS